MAKLPIDEYAQDICAAIDSYDFPAVTYDFGPAPFSGSDPERIGTHGSMIGVEKTIKKQMFKPGLGGVKDGLSNILYWGYADLPGRQNNRVPRFRRKVTSTQLAIFSHVARNMQGTGLVNISTIELPHLDLMPFVSRIRMFLDPDNYPVLDSQIVRFANSDIFPPLKHLNMYTSNIPVTVHNEQVYEEWALWCRETARTVNSYPHSPRKDLRAVDIQRGITQLVRSGGNVRPWRLLQGPQT